MFALLYSMSGVTETAHYYSLQKIQQFFSQIAAKHSGYNHKGIIFCVSVITANVVIFSKKGHGTLRKQTDYDFN